MAPSERVPRIVKAEGADLIVGKGYITAADFPKLIEADWREEFHAQVNDELRLRTVTQRACYRNFETLVGKAAHILYDPERYSDDEAFALVRRELDA